MSATRSLTILLLVLVTLLAYGNSLQNSFVWDDDSLIAQNSYIRNFSYISIAFLSDLFHNDSPTAIRYYRPLQTISYMVDYRLWGLNPFGYHFTNLLLHLFCVLLVALLVEQLFPNRFIAFTVAGLFAVHPVLTNAVTYVSGRADSLAFAGMLAAWLLWRKQTLFTYIGAVFCYLAALCSRENAFLFPILIFLQGWLLDKKNMRQAVLDALPFLLLAAAFAVWRHAVLSLHGGPPPTTWSLPWSTRLQLPFRSLATYLGLLIWPSHLQMERQVVFGGHWVYALTAIGAVAAIGLTALALYDRFTRFGVCWFGATWLPISGLLNLNATVAEHWLYVPCVGLFLAFVAPIPQTKTTTLLLATILTAFTARTAIRNRDWKNSLTLYSRTKGVAPHSVAVRANLGLEYAAVGRTNEALSELLEAQHIAPDSLHTAKNLAILYRRLGNLAEAQGKVADALQRNPRDLTALLQAALIWEARGDFQKARLYYLRAMAQTRNVPLRLEYGQFLLRNRRYHEALQIADEICAMEPPNAEGHNLRGVILAELGRFQEAQRAFELAMQRDRHSSNARQNLARLHKLQQQHN